MGQSALLGTVVSISCQTRAGTDGFRKVQIQFFLHAMGGGELLHCKMDADVEERKGWC